MESRPWTAQNQASNHLVPNSCEVTTSSLAALNLSSLGTPPPRRWDLPRCCVCVQYMYGAGSVYNLAVYVLPMR
jgi:hypothetical protein